MEINIIHEDKDLIILDKPTGVIVNNSQTHSEFTVQDFLIKNYSKLFVKEGSEKAHNENNSNKNLDSEKLTDEERDNNEFFDKNGIVHRLDKDTSGIMVIAKNPKSYTYIKNQFKNREVTKEYRALATGNITEQKLQINAPLKRSPKHPLKFAVVQQGKPALTFIEILSKHTIKDKTYTLLKVLPKTGRTHQIRVHLAAINHAIAGDKLYLSKINHQLTFEIFGRLMLHALSLEFKHPSNEDKVKYFTQIPKEFIF